MQSQSHASNLLAYDLWLKEIGITDCTGWRWRKAGMIEVQNIAGRLYISRTAIAEFERRVKKGEFSKLHRTPTRTKESPTV